MKSLQNISSKVKNYFNNATWDDEIKQKFGQFASNPKINNLANNFNTQVNQARTYQQQNPTSRVLKDYVNNTYVAAAKDIPQAISGIVKPQPLNIGGFQFGSKTTRALNVGRLGLDVLGAVPDPTDIAFAGANYLKGYKQARNQGSNLVQSLQSGEQTMAGNKYVGLGDSIPGLTENQRTAGNLAELPLVLAAGFARNRAGAKQSIEQALKNEQAITELVGATKNWKILPQENQIGFIDNLRRVAEQVIPDVVNNKEFRKQTATDPDTWIKTTSRFLEEALTAAKNPDKLDNFGFQAKPLRKLDAKIAQQSLYDVKVYVGNRGTKSSGKYGISTTIDKDVADMFSEGRGLKEYKISNKARILDASTFKPSEPSVSVLEIQEYAKTNGYDAISYIDDKRQFGVLGFPKGEQEITILNPKVLVEQAKQSDSSPLSFSPSNVAQVSSPKQSLYDIAENTRRLNMGQKLDPEAYVEVYHGTSAPNLKSIEKGGFKLGQPAHNAGKGDRIYVSTTDNVGTYSKGGGVVKARVKVKDLIPDTEDVNNFGQYIVKDPQKLEIIQVGEYGGNTYPTYRKAQQPVKGGLYDTTDEIVYHGGRDLGDSAVLKRGFYGGDGKTPTGQDSGGIFFTNSKKYAEGYAGGKGAVYQKAITKGEKETLFDITNSKHVEKFKEGFTKNWQEEYSSKADALQDAEMALKSIKETTQHGAMDWATGSQYVDQMEKAGFKGAKFLERAGDVSGNDFDGFKITGKPIYSYALFGNDVPVTKVGAKNVAQVSSPKQSLYDTSKYKNVDEFIKSQNIDNKPFDVKDDFMVGKPVAYEKLPKDYKIKQSHIDSISGEQIMAIKVLDKNGDVVGKIDYGLYHGEPNIKMIEVDPAQRRKGIATAMLDKMQEMYPDKKIDVGMSTDDGAKLLKNYDFGKAKTQLTEIYNQSKNVAQGGLSDITTSNKQQGIVKLQGSKDIQTPPLVQKASVGDQVNPNSLAGIISQKSKPTIVSVQKKITDLLGMDVFTMDNSYKRNYYNAQELLSDSSLNAMGAPKEVVDEVRNLRNLIDEIREGNKATKELKNQKVTTTSKVQENAIRQFNDEMSNRYRKIEQRFKELKIDPKEFQIQRNDLGQPRSVSYVGGSSKSGLSADKAAKITADKDFKEWKKALDSQEGIVTRTKAIDDLTKQLKTATVRGVTGMDSASTWKDPARLKQVRETMDRVFEDVMGKQAPAMKKKFLDPVYEAVARETKFMNKERAEIKALGIKARSKESAILQDFGEGKLTQEQVTKMTGDSEKIFNAEKVLRQKYDQYLEQINKTLVRNGYDPIPKRKDYFRHFQDLGDKFGELGVALKANDLPTDISGLSADFKPGKNFFTSALQRKGGAYTSDAITGIDEYLEGASKQIYRTDSIQALRELETAVRTEFAGKSNLSNFAANLTEYTNQLAGKKAMVDRAVESVVGRRLYSVANVIKKQTGANMIGANIAASITNTIPITQTLATTDKRAIGKTLVDMMASVSKGSDDLVSKSNFLTSRYGSDRISKTKWGKVADVGNIPFKAVDRFMSEFVVRSKFEEGLQKGLSEVDALKRADDWGRKLLAGRSAGEKPTLFGSQTLGFFTQFQLEVNNQLSFLLKDIPRNYDKKGTTSAVTQLLVYSYLFNGIYEKAFGRRPALDPIGVAQEAYEDYTNPDMKDGQATKNLTGNITDQLPFVSTFTGGRIPVSSALPNPFKIVSGESTIGREAIKLATYLLPPTGGGQIKKTIEGLMSYGKGASTSKSGAVRFPIEQNPQNLVKSAIAGQWSTPEAQTYIREGRGVLGEKQTEKFFESDNKKGFYDNIIAKRNSGSDGSTVADAYVTGELPTIDNDFKVLYDDATKVVSGYADNSSKIRTGIKDTQTLEEAQIELVQAQNVLRKMEQEQPERVYKIGLDVYESGGGKTTEERADWAYEWLGKAKDEKQYKDWYREMLDKKVLTKAVVEQLAELGLDVDKYVEGGKVRSLGGSGGKAKKLKLSGVNFDIPTTSVSLKSTPIPQAPKINLSVPKGSTRIVAAARPKTTIQTYKPQTFKNDLTKGIIRL